MNWLLPRRLPGLLLLALATCLFGCPQDAKTGPVEITWDRDQCASCGMVISEPHFAAEVRGGPKGALAKFDDIGCALKWLGSQSWAEDTTTEIWVARRADRQWLNAKTAKYLAGKSSPMGYGFAAMDPGAEGLDFAAVRAHVRALDAKH